MKFPQLDKNPDAPSRANAWACLTTNLVMPGAGSLMGGRRVGFFQLALTFVALAMTVLFGLRFIVWTLQNWSRLQDPVGDPLDTLLELWLAVRWALAGMGLFVAAVMWALTTSLSIMSRAKKHQP
ncbi:MAG: hypothetical protein EPO07_02985 [Verrucomicrobia bacterium]|nr:MAG: hypothetical protein EPO07_02985 [Verrucomicrobiota bacterium]